MAKIQDLREAHLEPLRNGERWYENLSRNMAQYGTLGHRFRKRRKTLVSSLDGLEAF